MQTRWMIIVFLALVLGATYLYGEPAQASSDFNYQPYAQVLDTYVNPQGMVDYESLKAHRAKLEQFVSSMDQLDPGTYRDWNTPDKVAFWINAYNALTLKAIIDHYPIKASFFASLRFPRNSIRQISGVWDRLEFVVMGRKVTLDYIEHQILRKEFGEARIHMALVCAATGCPPLRREPYLGERLEEQFKEQTRRFLADSAKFRLDRGKRVVYLSSIFKWFGQDFVKHYGTDSGFFGRSAKERAVLNFVSMHLDQADRKYLSQEKYGLEYLDYDWSLNELKSGGR